MIELCMRSITGRQREMLLLHADGMKQVMDEINQLEKTTIEQPKYIEFREYGPTLALLALALLMLGFIAECTWNLRLP